jgi:hypothetical protein
MLAQAQQGAGAGGPDMSFKTLIERAIPALMPGAAMDGEPKFAEFHSVVGKDVLMHVGGGPRRIHRKVQNQNGSVSEQVDMRMATPHVTLMLFALCEMLAGGDPLQVLAAANFKVADGRGELIYDFAALLMARDEALDKHMEAEAMQRVNASMSAEGMVTAESPAYAAPQASSPALHAVAESWGAEPDMSTERLNQLLRMSESGVGGE